MDREEEQGRNQDQAERAAGHLGKAEIEVELENAKTRIEELEGKLKKAGMETTLAQKLVRAGAVDIEAAMAMAKARAAENPDTDAVIEQLRKDKQYLFDKATTTGGQKTAGARERNGRGSGALERAAKAAASTGGRAQVQEYLRGGAYDFSPVLGHGNFVQSRRRFWPSLSCDATGKSLGYYLEVSYDGGSHWWQYLHAFKVLLNECGIWLCSDQLDMDTWWAAIKGSLRMRVTASVLDDERISHTVTRGAVGGMVDVIDHVITEPRKYQFKRICPKSIFYGSRAANNRQRDDRASVINAAMNHSQRLIACEEIMVESPIVLSEVRPGDVLEQDNELMRMGTDMHSTVIVDKVCIDFHKQITTVGAVKYTI